MNVYQYQYCQALLYRLCCEYRAGTGGPPGPPGPWARRDWVPARLIRGGKRAKTGHKGAIGPVYQLQEEIRNGLWCSFGLEA